MSVFTGKIAFFGENVCFHGENSVFGSKCLFSRGKSRFWVSQKSKNRSEPYKNENYEGRWMSRAGRELSRSL